jgi:hypothetical protein
MRKIFAIAWKDAIARFANPSELLFFIVLPVVFTFILAGGTPQGNEDPRIDLLVVDEAKTSISQQVIDELENSTAVNPELTTRDEAQSLFDDRRAEVVLIIAVDIASLRWISRVGCPTTNNLSATVAEHGSVASQVSSAISAAQLPSRFESMKPCF